MLPNDCKDIDNLYIFKNKVKKWKDETVLAGSVKLTLKESLGYSISIFWNYGCCLPVSFCYQ